MWGKGEKGMMLRGQDIYLYSNNSDLSFKQNKGLAHPNDGSNEQFFAEASRKRKAMDSDLVNNVYDGPSPKFSVNHSGNFSHMLPRDSSLQHNVVTTDHHWRTPEMFSGPSSLYSRPSNALSQGGDYQFCNMNNNSIMSLQGRNDNAQEAAVDSSRSCAFLKEPSSLTRPSDGGITRLTDLRSPAYDIPSYSKANNFRSYNYEQIGDSMGKTQDALRSNSGMNSRLENNYMPSAMCPSSVMPSQNFAYSESSQLRMINEEFKTSGGTYMQGFFRSGLHEVKKSDQNIGLLEDNNIPIYTANCGQTSVKDGKEAHISYQYSNTEIRSTGHLVSDILGAQRNVSSVDVLPLPVSISSDREGACADNGLKNMGHVSKDLETQILEKQDGPNNEDKCHSLGKEVSPETDKIHARGPAELSDGPSSLSWDERNKPVATKISPVIIEKLWEGSLQLNTSTVVSTVAFFKSGEKTQDINWSEHIEIKGKVRLQAFEKFIQELPRSRNRALMVISLRWKAGSSRDGLMGMKEVSKGYRQSERVGFAQICPGIDLYVCPRSDTIITILAKYGFFKGMAAIEEDHDSLIGCVIWRRGLPSSSSVPQKPEKKKAPEQLLNSPEPSILETSSPLTIANDSDSKLATPCTRGPDAALVSESRSADLDDARDQTTEAQLPPAELNMNRVKIGETRSHGLGSESTQPPLHLSDVEQPSKDLHSHGSSPAELNSSVPFNARNNQFQPSAPQQPYSSSRQDPTDSSSDTGFELKRPTPPGPPKLPPDVLQRMIQASRNNAHQVGTSHPVLLPSKSPHEPINRASMVSEPTGLPQSHSLDRDDEDDLPEFDFSSASGAPEVPAGKFPWWGHQHKPPVMPMLEISLQTRSKELKKTEDQLLGSCNFPQKIHWDEDDDDMPEWCPPQLGTTISPTHGTTSENAAHWPPMPAYQPPARPGLLGSHPAAGFVPVVAPNPRPPSEVDWRLRRP